VIQRLFTGRDRVYEDADVAVYRTPATPGRQGADGTALPLVGLGSGWHKLEQNPAHRWTGSNVTDGNALVWVGVPAHAEGAYTLDMIAYSYRSPRHLSVVLDGTTLLSKELGTAFEDLKVDLGTLNAGDHILMLKVQEPPESPPGDTRKLGIGVTKIEVRGR
jgi:hypothetical protein